MIPQVKTFPGKKLVGFHDTMSLADNRTADLWKRFMLRRNEVPGIGSNLYSVQVYGPSYSFSIFDSSATFTKWATKEIADFENIPDGMEYLTTPSGSYAVFIHKGGPARGHETFTYIFNTWLPASDYLLDNRPHFEILGSKYKGNEPDSEEEIWIPIREKGSEN